MTLLEKYQNNKNSHIFVLTRIKEKDNHLVIFLFQLEINYVFARITRKY